jgi:type VI protein secretion system component VasK
MLGFAYIFQRVKNSPLTLIAIGVTIVFLSFAWQFEQDLFYRSLWVLLKVAGLILFLEILCWLIATYAKDNDKYTVLEGKKVRKKGKEGLVMFLAGDLIKGDAFDGIDGGDGADGD